MATCPSHHVDGPLEETLSLASVALEVTGEAVSDHDVAVEDRAAEGAVSLSFVVGCAAHTEAGALAVGVLAACLYHNPYHNPYHKVGVEGAFDSDRC